MDITNLPMVLLVGSNPSKSSPTSIPFHPLTKSRQRIDTWFDNSYIVEFVNLVDYKTINNKPLTKKEIVDNLTSIRSKFDQYNNFKIIACGKTAAMGLKLLNIDHFEIPHPSGLCRFWNDKTISEAKIKEMLEWVNTSNDRHRHK